MILKMEFPSMIILLLCLMKTVYIRAQSQCGTPYPGNNRILTELSQASYPVGSSVTFKCAVGYKPENHTASKTMTCTGTGWTELALQCKKKSCGSPPDISFGSFSYFPEGDDGILYGATATAKCDEGYKIVGKPERRCVDSGWDGKNPVCEAAKCRPPPSHIENGRVTEDLKDEYVYNEVVTYECYRDFYPTGSLLISCLENGSFPLPPQCKKVSCDPITVPNARRIQGIPPYKLKSIIEFKCEQNYKMVGAGYLVCDVTGWNPLPPNCTEVSCDPITVPNATRIQGIPPYKLKSIIEFKCEQGYKMVGAGYLVCDVTGWNPLPPTCTVITEPTTKGTTPRTPTRSTLPTDKDEREIPTSPTPPDNSKKTIGIVVGVLVVIVALAFIGYLVHKNSKHGYFGKVATSSEEGTL